MAGDIVERLSITSAMIHLGEMIAWGEDTALMDEAATEIATLRRQLEEARERNLLANNRADNAEADAAKARAMALEEAAAEARGFWKGDDTREHTRGWNACSATISDHLDQLRALSAPQGREG